MNRDQIREIVDRHFDALQGSDYIHDDGGGINLLSVCNDLYEALIAANTDPSD